MTLNEHGAKKNSLQISDIISALVLAYENEFRRDNPNSCCPPRPTSPTEADSQLENDLEWVEDGLEDEDSGGEDSDDDSIANKLCTFTTTQKEFMNQHW